MIRLSARFLGAAALLAFFVSALQIVAQQHVPPAPDSTAAQPAPPPEEPSAAPAQEGPAPTPTAPAPSGPPVFPQPDPANFTALAPTKEVVNAFLEANWGYDADRMWQVQAILKTPVEGVSKVIVLFGDKTGRQKPQVLIFFALPDGKHIIAGEDVINFGEHPFADVRQQLQQRADGPYRGSASKNLEIVEFADFQCPHCKEAQANMDKLAVDYPNARIVFQVLPIPAIHPESVTAAEYGVCVTKLGGSSAFFQYAAAVFDGQDGLATSDGATLTLNSAVAKAGLDPAKVSTCAATPEVKANVDAAMQLGRDLGINEVPTLAVNGRTIPATVPYDMLKRIIDYQIKADGLAGFQATGGAAAITSAEGAKPGTARAVVMNYLATAQVPGWTFSSADSHIVSENVSEAEGKATIAVEAVFKGGSTQMVVSVRFDLVVESGTWRISKMDPPNLAPGVEPL